MCVFVALQGNAGLRWHFPALFEPTQGLGGPEDEQDTPQLEGDDVEEREVQVFEQREEEVEEGPRLAQRLGAAVEAHISVEVQIGRKLREIGDHFNQEQLQAVRKSEACVGARLGWARLSGGPNRLWGERDGSNGY